MSSVAGRHGALEHSRYPPLRMCAPREGLIFPYPGHMFTSLVEAMRVCLDSERVRVYSLLSQASTRGHPASEEEATRLGVSLLA